jgi:hypothetical protein
MYFIPVVTNEMRLVERRSLCLILISLCAACCARAQSQVSQAEAKAFVTEYVAAYDSKDAARLQALYDFKSRTCFTGEGKDFYDGALAVMWRNPIPATYTFSVSAINEINMKAIESFGRFALKPTRELHIDYQQGDDVGSVVVYLVHENGRWRADQPCASEQSLKQFRDEAPARKEREAHFKSLADAIQEPVRSQFIALLREHKTAEAIDRYKEASGQDGQTAMLVIDQLALELKH